MLNTLVYNWLIAGADPQVGLRLFITYAKPLPAIRNLVSKNPVKHLAIIKNALLYISGVELAPPSAPGINVLPSKTPERKQTIREDYPFLKEDSCPPELKILVADKITTFQNYVESYDKLKQAKNSGEHLEAVAYLVENFIKNQEIHKEFEHYKKDKQILGKHAIFKEYAQFRSLRKLSALELARMKTNLENNIYRTKKLLASEPREDLRIKREDTLRKHQRKLAEIERLLS